MPLITKGAIMKPQMLFALAIVVFSLHQMPLAAQPQPLREFNKKVAKAWRQAGAESGWMTSRTAFAGSPFSSVSEDTTVEADDLPAFRFSLTPGSPRKVSFANLPAPNVPFGIEIRNIRLS